MNDPFSIFGIPPGFEVDLDDLHRRLINLSSAHHPDRFSDPDEQADAADASASINEAFRTLSNPESRANALLALMGGPAKEADNSLPQGFLIEIMEVREELEEAVEAENHPALDEFREWAKNSQAAHLKKITALFRDAKKTGAIDPARSVALRAVRLELNALRYIERMLEEIPDGN